MSPSRSPTRSAGGILSNPRAAFEEVEALESALISHLHTSGLRPQRETSLVDEVMSIRRERRKLFASLISHSQTQDRQVALLKEQCKRLQLSCNSFEATLSQQIDEKVSIETV